MSSALFGVGKVSCDPFQRSAPLSRVEDGVPCLRRKGVHAERLDGIGVVRGPQGGQRSDLHVPKEACRTSQAPGARQLVFEEAALAARRILIGAPAKGFQLGGNRREAPGEGLNRGLLQVQDTEEDVRQPSPLQLTREGAQGTHGSREGALPKNSPRARAGLRRSDLPGPRDPRRGSVARTSSRDNPAEVATATSHGRPASRGAAVGRGPGRRLRVSTTPRRRPRTSHPKPKVPGSPCQLPGRFPFGTAGKVGQGVAAIEPRPRW